MILSLVESLHDKLSKAEDASTVLEVLHEIEEVPEEHINVQLLEASKIGVSVGKLRKHKEKTISTVAARIIKKWKKQVSKVDEMGTTSMKASTGETSAPLPVVDPPAAPPHAAPPHAAPPSALPLALAEPPLQPAHALAPLPSDHAAEEEGGDDESPPKAQQLLTMVAALASSKDAAPKGRTTFAPPLGSLIFGAPLCRGAPSLGDHGIGRIDKVPIKGLDESYGVLFLWRDVGDGTPLDVRRVEFHKDKLKCFIELSPSPCVWPYLEEDIKLLTKGIARPSERELWAAAGYYVHHRS